jgi:DNA-binding MarR family transcriptional regulator
MKVDLTFGDFEQNILTATRVMVNILAEAMIQAGVEGISAQQFRILDMVYNKISNQADIARMLNISNSAINVQLGKLEDRMLITRLQSTSDHRRIEIILTPEGLDIAGKVNENRESCLDAVCKKMGQRNASQLDNLLGTFNSCYFKLKG